MLVFTLARCFDKAERTNVCASERRSIRRSIENGRGMRRGNHERRRASAPRPYRVRSACFVACSHDRPRTGHLFCARRQKVAALGAYNFSSADKWRRAGVPSRPMQVFSHPQKSERRQQSIESTPATYSSRSSGLDGSPQLVALTRAGVRRNECARTESTPRHLVGVQGRTFEYNSGRMKRGASSRLAGTTSLGLALTFLSACSSNEPQTSPGGAGSGGVGVPGRRYSAA